MSRAATTTGRPGPTARILCALCGFVSVSSARAKLSPPRSPGARPQTALIEPRLESPEERLARGQQAYMKSDFSSTVAALSSLLYPEIQLRSEEDVQSAHRLLALAFLFQHAEPSAETEFSALLQLNPNFALDQVSDPPSAIAFLDRLKRREHERVEEIQKRRREEADVAARDEDRRRRTEEEKRLRESEERIRRSIRPTIIEKHSLAVAFIPFGAGQFQNGERKKAWGFFGSQLALGAASLSMWSALELKYAFGQKKVPAEEVNQVQYLRTASTVAGGLFWADVAWGLIDAFVHYRSQTVRVGQPGQGSAPGAMGAEASGPRASIRPFMTPGGAGLSIGGTF